MYSGKPRGEFPIMLYGDPMETSEVKQDWGERVREEDFDSINKV